MTSSPPPRAAGPHHGAPGEHPNGPNGPALNSVRQGGAPHDLVPSATGGSAHSPGRFGHLADLLPAWRDLPPGAPPPRPASRALRLAVARPKAVLVVVTLLMLAIGGIGAAGLGKLKTGGFDDPTSDSVRGQHALVAHFGAAQPNLVVLIEPVTGGVDSPAARTIGDSVTATLRATPGAQVVASYYPSPIPELRARSGRAALIVVNVRGDEDASARLTKKLHTALARDNGPVLVRFGGITQIDNDLNAQATKDLAKAESIAIPLTLLLLLVVFGTVVAAGLPLLIGLLSIAGTLGILGGLAAMTNVSIFSVNLATALGLGLAVDYCLLFVSRYRDELEAGRRPAGHSPEATGRMGGAPGRGGRQVEHGDVVVALDATMRTAGRTIVFSAATVATSLCCLLVFRQYFLRSFAVAAVAVVAITLIGALLALPALLVLLGERIERWPVPGRRRRTPTPLSRAGGPEKLSWLGRTAALAWRRPALCALPVLTALLAIGSPSLGVHFGVPDERPLPSGVESRQVATEIRTDFGVIDDGSVGVVATAWGRGPVADAQAAQYAARLSLVPGVDRVDSAVGSYARGARISPPGPVNARFVNGNAMWFSVLSQIPPYSSAGGKLATTIRDLPVPGGRTVLVTGQGAQLVDIIHSIGARLPWALALLAVCTLILLFLMTGSVLLPVKVLVFNLLSLSAIFGVMVWIFQEGHLSGLLGFTPSPIPVAIPVLMFCAAFGLSMDYAVFVLARIREQHLAGEPLRESVVHGIDRGGRVVSAAAAILAVSFFSTAVSGVSFIKMFGLGAGLAVLLDALVVRSLLVPAFIRVAGKWNWWAPGPLRAWHDRFGWREGSLR